MKYVGKRVPRYDGLGHVTGKTKFVNDISLPGMLTVKVLRSSVARADLLNIDVTECVRMPGVEGVVTAKDVPNNSYGFYPDQPVLAETEIRFIGQPIVAVAAINEETAIKALSKIKLDLNIKEPVLDPVKAMKPGAPLVRSEGNTWVFDDAIPCRKIRVGDIDEGFAEADFIVESNYSTPAQEHAMIENNCSVAEIDEGGRMNIYTESQGVFFHLGHMSGILQMPMNKINMIGGTVGGGFGGRNDVTSDHITALCALKTNKPCKWLWTREEEMLCSQIRGAWQFCIKAGVKKNGKIIALKINTIHDTGAYSGFGPYAVDKSCFTIVGPYDIPNVYIDGWCVFTNKAIATSMRGFGINIGQFAMESHLDKLAKAAGISPWDIRFVNAWKEGSVSATKQVMHDVAIIETMQAAAKLAGEELPHEYMEMGSK